jgi:hypothetical protein
MSMAKLAALAVAVATLASATACTKSSGGRANDSSAALQPHAGGRVTLTGNELRYGSSVKRDAGIVYQPGVVIIGGGADSVRSVSANGLVWTIDAHAPGAQDLAVGKVLAATSLGTGRVLNLTRQGDTDEVLLGPVSLTDVIRDADIRSSAPVALADPLYYATPGAPGSVAPPEGASHSPHSVREHRLTAGNSSVATRPEAQIALANDPTLPAPATQPTPVSLGHFTVTPFLNGKGLGVRIAEQHGSGRLVGTLALRMSAPTVTYTLVIRDSKIAEASVRLHGAGGIHVDFVAAEKDSSGSFGNETLNVPVELSIPLVPPFRLTISQSFDMALLLSGSASLTGHGDYSIAGDLKFGVRDGKPLISANTVGVADPLDRNITSLGVASNTLQLGYAVKAGISIGVPGLSASAWLKVRFGLTVVSDVPLSALSSSCVSDSISVDASYGVGYELPGFLIDAVNAFLRIFGVPKVPATGGFKWGPTGLITPPAAKYCPH